MNKEGKLKDPLDEIFVEEHSISFYKKRIKSLEEDKECKHLVGDWCHSPKYSNSTQQKCWCEYENYKCNDMEEATLELPTKKCIKCKKEMDKESLEYGSGWCINCMGKDKFNAEKLPKIKLNCSKCQTEQIMEKRIIGDTYTFYCPNCKDQISKSAVSSPITKQSEGDKKR